MEALEHGLLKPELWEDHVTIEGGPDDGSEDSVDGESRGATGESEEGVCI